MRSFLFLLLVTFFVVSCVIAAPTETVQPTTPQNVGSSSSTGSRPMTGAERIAVMREEGLMADSESEPAGATSSTGATRDAMPSGQRIRPSSSSSSSMMRGAVPLTRRELRDMLEEDYWMSLAMAQEMAEYEQMMEQREAEAEMESESESESDSDSGANNTETQDTENMNEEELLSSADEDSDASLLMESDADFEIAEPYGGGYGGHHGFGGGFGGFGGKKGGFGGHGFGGFGGKKVPPKKGGFGFGFGGFGGKKGPPKKGFGGFGGKKGGFGFGKKGGFGFGGI